MQNEDGRAGRETDEQHHGSGRPARLGIGRSLRPGTGVPPRVLVTDMGDGSLFLQGWRDGPSAHLSQADAVPLRRELAAAFGSTELTLRCDGGLIPRRQEIQVSVQGVRSHDGTECTLLAICETGGTWIIHSLDQGAVRLTQEQAVRMATAILHLVGARAKECPQGE